MAWKKIPSSAPKPGTPITENRAREIMGNNIIVAEDAFRNFHLHTPTALQREALSVIKSPEGVLASEELLFAHRETHVLDANTGVPIAYLLTVLPPDLIRILEWWKGKSFLEEQTKPGWHLVRKAPLEGSFHLTVRRQLEMLGKNEIVPKVQVLTSMILGMHLTTGDRLYELAQGTCADTVAKGNAQWHVCAGSFSRKYGMRFDEVAKGAAAIKWGLASEIVF